MSSKLRMIALYDCTADDAEELSFKEGDIFVDVTQSTDKDWYEGRIENTSKRGLFPGNFVKPLPESFGVDLTNNNKLQNDMTKTNGALSNDAFTAVLSNSSIKNESIKKTTERGSKGSNLNKGSFISAVNKPICNSAPSVLASKPMSGSPSTKNAVRVGMKLPAPTSTFERPQLKSIEQESPTRVRSYSASFVKNTTDNNLERVLRPSQLASGGKSELEIALSKGSSKPLSTLRSDISSKYGSSTGIPLVGLENSKAVSSSHEEEEEEDEDGFQLIKPSQIRLQKLQTTGPILPKPIIPTYSASYASKVTATSSTENWKKPSNAPVSQKPKGISSSSKLENIPAPSNPMPRLPSRPVSTASRKSRNSRSSSSDVQTSTSSSLLTKKASVKEEELHQEIIPDKTSLPPVLKPKPQLSQPALPPRPKKLRSVSNPPPLQPKPVCSSADSTNSSTNLNVKSMTNITNQGPQTPPRVGIKPSSVLYQQKLQQQPTNGFSHAISPPLSPSGKFNQALSSPRTMFSNLNSEEKNEGSVSGDANLKPSALLNRARSATNPPYFGPKPTMDNMPKLNSSTKKTPSAGLSIPKSSTNNTRIVSSEKANETKKKVAPPPPPPSRPPKNDNKFVDSGAKARYETLFDQVHDSGYVDGETVYCIWMKSKLPKKELACLWKECDPDHKGLLDKNAFIHGMGKIDVILKKHQLEQSA